MNAMKVRLLAIGGVNAAIGLILMSMRGFSLLIAGYIIVSLAVFAIGFLFKEK